MKKRLDYIDMVKGWGILGIVIMHSAVVPEQADSWISSFAPPLFFLVAGMLIGCTGEPERSGKDILLRKGRSLMLPFWCFSLLYILRDVLRAALGTVSMEEVRMGGIFLVTLWGSSVLWFLPALFLSEGLFILLRKKLDTMWTCVAGIMLTAVSFFANDVLMEREVFFLSGELYYALFLIARAIVRAIYALPYLCIGYVLFILMRDFWEAEREFSLWQFLGGIVLFFTGIPLSVANSYLDLRVLYMGTIPVAAYLSATLSFAGLLLACKNCRTIKPLAYFGKNSLIVMATHIDFYFLYLVLWLRDSILPEKIPVFSFLIVVGGILILEVPCIEVIGRFFPFLTGKRKYSHSRESLL